MRSGKGRNRGVPKQSPRNFWFAPFSWPGSTAIRANLRLHCAESASRERLPSTSRRDGNGLNPPRPGERTVGFHAKTNRNSTGFEPNGTHNCLVFRSGMKKCCILDQGVLSSDLVLGSPF